MPYSRVNQVSLYGVIFFYKTKSYLWIACNALCDDGKTSLSSFNVFVRWWSHLRSLQLCSSITNEISESHQTAIISCPTWSKEIDFFKNLPKSFINKPFLSKWSVCPEFGMNSWAQAKTWNGWSVRRIKRSDILPDGWSSSPKALSMTFKSNLEMNLQKEQLSWLDY